MPVSTDMLFDARLMSRNIGSKLTLPSSNARYFQGVAVSYEDELDGIKWFADYRVSGMLVRKGNCRDDVRRYGESAPADVVPTNPSALPKPPSYAI